MRLSDQGGSTTGHSAEGVGPPSMPAPGAGEDLSVSSLRFRFVACLRALVALGMLIAIALAESAGRRWPQP